MKYGIIFFDELIAILNSQTDAEEMYLALAQELEHEMFLKTIHGTMSPKKYMEYYPERFSEKYGNENAYEKKVLETARFSSKLSFKLDSKTLVKLVSAKYFEN